MKLVLLKFKLYNLRSDENMNDLNLVKGIGKVSINNLNKLGIYTVDDLINYYPFRYEVLKQTSLEEENVIVSGIIESSVIVNFFKKMNKLSFRLNTNGKLVNVIIFNRGFLKNNLQIGKTVTVIGK